MLHDLYYLKDIANNSHPFQPSPINKINWQRHETRHLFLKNSLSVLRTFKVIEKKKKTKQRLSRLSWTITRRNAVENKESPLSLLNPLECPTHSKVLYSLHF